MMIDEGSSGSGQGSGNTGGMGVGVGGGMKWAAGVTTALTTRYPTQKNTGMRYLLRIQHATDVNCISCKLYTCA